MIRKLGRVSAPLGIVRSMFFDIESWPDWMPDFRAVRLLDGSGDRLLYEVKQVQGSGIRTSRLEYRFHETGYAERLVSKGYLMKAWTADWNFQEPPAGDGTVVTCRVEAKVRFLGIAAPRMIVQSVIDKYFARLLVSAEAQARRLMTPEKADDEPRTGAPEQVRIQLFATPDGLEVWIGDQKYVAFPED